MLEAMEYELDQAERDKLIVLLSHQDERKSVSAFGLTRPLLEEAAAGKPDSGAGGCAVAHREWGGGLSFPVGSRFGD